MSFKVSIFKPWPRSLYISCKENSLPRWFMSLRMVTIKYILALARRNVGGKKKKGITINAWWTIFSGYAKPKMVLQINLSKKNRFWLSLLYAMVNFIYSFTIPQLYTTFFSPDAAIEPVQPLTWYQKWILESGILSFSMVHYGSGLSSTAAPALTCKA